MARYLSLARIEGPIWLEQSDISFLRTGISNVETQLETLDRQISELTRQKDAKLVESKLLKNILAPVRRVPAEILSDIFQLLCLPEEGIPMYEHDIVESLSILSAVCVAWRTAVHGTPQFWSKLCLYLKGYHEPIIPKPGWVKEWINRSRGHSLDLYLDFDKARSGVSPIRLGRFMETVLDFSHKLRFLNLKGPISLFVPLFHLPPSSLPQVEQAYLNVFSFKSFINYPDSLDEERTAYLQIPHQIGLFSGVSRLRHLEFIERDSISVLKRLVLPVEQLTSLKISSNIWEDNAARFVYVDIIHRCKDLVHLQVDLGLDFEPNLDLHKHFSISLPSLKSLDISAYNTLAGFNNDRNLLKRLTTPRLEEFTLRHKGQDLNELAMELTSFQHRSATTLSSLTLYTFCSLDEADESMAQTLIGLLSLFPTIRSFRMKYCSFNMNPLLRAMAFTQSHPVLLPKLTHFEFAVDADVEYYSELTPMILSRYWPDRAHEEQSDCSARGDLFRLQKVFLRLCCIEDDKFTEITELPGLTVDIDLLE